MTILFLGLTLQIKESFNGNETSILQQGNLTEEIISQSSAITTALSILPISKYYN